MKLIAGNWKMNCTKPQATALVTELLPLVKDSPNKIVVCVPFTAIDTVSALVKGTPIALGAQNVAWAKSGAFTAEVSAEMLVDAGVEYVIIGHSERRTIFGETDSTVNKRTLAALAAGLKAIVCVGETLEERDGGVTEQVCHRQLVSALDGVKSIDNLVIAYEPVWAIGTGRTASPEDANATITYIYGVLGQLFGDNAKKIDVLYGGSMNAANAASLLAFDNIRGGLIGGASLKPADFATICNTK